MSKNKEFHHMMMIVASLKNQREAILTAIQEYAEFWEETIEEGPFSEIYTFLKEENYPKMMEMYTKSSPNYQKESILLMLCTATVALGPAAANALFGVFSISLEEALDRGMDQAILSEEEQYLSKGQPVPKKLQEAAEFVRKKEEQLPLSEEDKEILKYAQRAQTNKIS